MPFEKLSKKLGFTQNEINVILFILVATVIGLVINLIKDSRNQKDFLEFNYKVSDSLFNAAAADPGLTDSTDIPKEKVIDSKRELLDFKQEKLPGKKEVKASTLTKKININTASLSQLTSLPGIGSKTAAGIVEYRKKRGQIKNWDELLNIKGIGKSKLNNLKSFVILE